MSAAPAVLIVAGEASADAHGAKVLGELRGLRPAVRPFGLGGPKLISAGLEPVAESRALNVVGISEALANLGAIRRTFKGLLDQVRARRPAVALLLDLPDFNLRLARRLKRLGVPVVYYIAPQAWAWRKGRVRQLRRRVEKLCVVFPFEEPFFRQNGVPVEFVGHPLTEEVVAKDPQSGCVALVPGSRPGEVGRLLPALAGAARILKREVADLRFVLPLAPGIDRPWVEGMLAAEGVVASLVEGGAREAYRQSDLALVASGTATLEAALAGVPMVVAYRVSRITYALVRPIYRLPHVCIVNILAGRTMVPELLQGRARAEAIAGAALPLLRDPDVRAAMIAGLRGVAESLGRRRPSLRVAEILTQWVRADG